MTGIPNPPPCGPAVITGSTPQARGNGPRNARHALAKAGLAVKEKTGGQPVLNASNDPRAGSAPATETKE